MRYSFL